MVVYDDPYGTNIYMLIICLEVLIIAIDLILPNLSEVKISTGRGEDVLQTNTDSTDNHAA